MVLFALNDAQALLLSYVNSPKNVKLLFASDSIINFPPTMVTLVTRVCVVSESAQSCVKSPVTLPVLPAEEQFQLCVYGPV